MTFTGQTPLGEGNFPFNLDNTVSIVQFPFRNKHGHPEKWSSKFPDLVLDINNTNFLQSYIEQTCFLTFLVCFVLFFFFGIFQASKNKRSVRTIKETPDRVGTTFFRVKYGLDDFFGLFFEPFMEPFFFGPFCRGGGSTPSVLMEGLDAVYRY